MIIDITGVELTPGNGGRDCLGNGEHYDNDGKIIECCCDECNYYLCCFERDYHKGLYNEDYEKMCKTCDEFDCPRNKVIPY